MKILVTDDSKTSLTIISQSLQKLGHDVLTASNGPDSIKIFQTERPDLIILDAIMSPMDGFETARKIRESETNDWIPIIFLSASVDDESIAKGIDAGGDDYLTKPCSDITLAAKILAMQRIADIRHKLLDANLKLTTLSATDALTGLYNRMQFDRSLKERISEADRYQQSLALLYIDLDHFKTVNDKLGHHIGDLLLKEVAERLKSCLRASEFIARLGGDEFAVIITHVKNQHDLETVAQKINTHLAKPYYLGKHTTENSGSIGIAVYPSEITDKNSIMVHADKAMYYAKQAGGNRFHFYTTDLLIE